jgi:cytochrome c oxidase subunit III
MSTAVSTWSDEAARREDTVRLGLWMFLATVAMLFAAFGSAYIVRRSGSDWTRVYLPSVLWVNTLVLAASSVALEAGRAFGIRHHWAAAGVTFGIAVALGLGFLCGQYEAWRQLMAAGIYLPSSPHSSFFYMMTAAHGVHVIGAIAVLLVASVHTWNGLGIRHYRRWTNSVGFARTFWHFLFGVWAFVLLILIGI